MQKGLFPGMFCLAMGILYLEVFATRVLSFVCGPEYLYATIAVAMLGMSAAASCVSLLRDPLEAPTATRWSARLCLAGAVSVALLFLGVTLLKDQVNAHEDAAIARGGFTALTTTLLETGHPVGAMVGLILAVPYFLLGAAMALLFRTTPGPVIPRLYAVDLVGACAGCLLAVALLEHGDYGPPLATAVILPLLAGLCFLPEDTRARPALFAGIAVIGLALAYGPVSVVFEPRPNLNRLSRNWDGKIPPEKIHELWHTWTSYGRIAAIEIERDGAPSDFLMSHGNGDGHAHIPTRPSDSDVFKIAVACSKPKSVLVLLAGCGSDMVSIDHNMGGTAAITGVELVPQVHQWPVSQPRFGLESFFSRPGIRMELAEAREFLARDRSHYGAILISFSGSNLSYYTGAATHAADYVYTKESLRSMLDHLEPGGQLTLLNGNKVRLILALRDLLEERGVHDPSRCFVVLRSGSQLSSIAWLGPYDPHILVVKPDGFGRPDIEALGAYRKLVYAPDVVSDDTTYTPAITGDPDYMVDDLKQRLLVDLSPSTDDRPFLLDVISPRVYLAKSFWTGETNNSVWNFKRSHLIILGLFTLIATVLVLGPVIVLRRRDLPASGSWNHLVFFSLLGGSFMMVEIGLLQKLQVLVGHPGLTLALGLGSLVLFTGVGSFLSEVVARRRGVDFRAAGLLTALVIAAHLVIYEQFAPSWVGLARPVKLLIAFVFPALPGIMMGQFFPQGLAALSRTAPSLVPWAVAVNGATGTVASGLGVTLAAVLGIRSLILMGVLGYLAIALMPHRVRQVTEN